MLIPGTDYREITRLTITDRRDSCLQFTRLTATAYRVNMQMKKVSRERSFFRSLDYCRRRGNLEEEVLKSGLALSLDTVSSASARFYRGESYSGLRLRANFARRISSILYQPPGGSNQSNYESIRSIRPISPSEFPTRHRDASIRTVTRLISSE